MEEFVVRTAVSGDMIGEPCCEFEATEEEKLVDEGGMYVGCDMEAKAVCT